MTLTPDDEDRIRSLIGEVMRKGQPEKEALQAAAQWVLDPERARRPPSAAAVSRVLKEIIAAVATLAEASPTPQSSIGDALARAVGAMRELTFRRAAEVERQTRDEELRRLIREELGLEAPSPLSMSQDARRLRTLEERAYVLSQAATEEWIRTEAAWRRARAHEAPAPSSPPETPFASGRGSGSRTEARDE